MYSTNGNLVLADEDEALLNDRLARPCHRKDKHGAEAGNYEQL